MSEWMKGFICGSASGLIGVLIGAFGADAFASERIDFVQRSLDKTIVVERNQTYTVPAPRGSGTNVIIKRRDNHNKEYRQPVYRGEKECSRMGQYLHCGRIVNSQRYRLQ